MIPAKQKVQLRGKPRQDAISIAEAAALELFPPKVEAFPLPVPRPITCIVCGEKDRTQAHAEHRVCTTCTDDPSVIAARLATLRAISLSHRRQCGEAYAASVAALSADEAPRWAAFCELWILNEAGMADAEQARKVVATLAAYKTPLNEDAAAVYAAGATLAEIAGTYGRDAARAVLVSPALRAAWAAWEAMYWADAGAHEETRRIDVRLATLGVCLEDLGRKADADALYTSKEPTP